MYSHAGRAICCMRTSRYLPLFTKRRATIRGNLSNSFLKKKRTPEIRMQMSKLDKISAALWEITHIGRMLLRGQNFILRMIFRCLLVYLMFSDSQKRALLYFMRQPSTIIGILLATSHSLNLGSVGHDRAAEQKSTSRTHVGSWQTNKETVHNKARTCLAGRMVNHVRRLTAQSQNLSHDAFSLACVC